MKNSPFKIFLLVLLVVLLLLPLHWLPELKIGNYEVKRVSIVSDVLSEEDVPGAPAREALPALPKVKPAVKDSCPKGMVGFENYGEDDAHNMRTFYAALSRINTLGRPVRIAYLGDSFIETDIFTSGLRKLLQDKFGGHGVGYLDMAPPYAANRPTVRQRYGGWSSHCVLNKGEYNTRMLGLSQRYFIPRGTAWTEIRGVNRPGLDSAEVHTLYLRSASPIRTGIKLDDSPMYALESQGTGRLEALSLNQRAGRVRWQVPGDAAPVCWGVAEESAKGVIVDNFSLRGSSGITLNEIPVENLKELNAVRPYDLIVLQFGLNVANKKQKDYSNYTNQLKKAVENIKEAFPNAGVLIVSVGDRENRSSDGQLHTIAGIHSLIRYQQLLAADCNVAFWNLYEGMGGEGSIKRMAEAKPVEAAKDYTHINERGGNRIANILFKSMVYGYEQYQRQQNQEGGK